MLASNIQLAVNEPMAFQLQSTQGSSSDERAEPSFDMLLQKEISEATDGNKVENTSKNTHTQDASESSQVDESVSLKEASVGIVESKLSKNAEQVGEELFASNNVVFVKDSKEKIAQLEVSEKNTVWHYPDFKKKEFEM